MIGKKPLRHFIAGLSAALFAAPFAETAHASDDPSPLSDCRIAGVDETLRCGEIRVPENPAAPDGRSISLHIVVLPALGPAPSNDPWMEFVGGPGNAATDFAASYAKDWKAFRAQRDVVLIDQRGTGRSNGLYCPELALHRVSSLFPRFPAKAVRSCRKKLSTHADLAQYSTRNAARDIEAVRKRLGYDKLNIFASSYGTRLALEYVKLFPDNIRSVMLWGVVAPDFRRPLFYARDGEQALSRLFDDCRTDASCNAAFPDPQQDLEAALRAIDGAREKLAIVDPLSGKSHKIAMSRAGFAQALWVALSVPEQARQLPFVIHAAAEGNFEPFLALDVATKPPRRRYDNGMHLSVACPEETAHISRDELARAYENSFMPVDRAREYLKACRIWNIPPTDLSSLAPARAFVPTLIVSGYMDPITPPSWGEKAREGLKNSRHIVVRRLSHESDGLIGAECLDALFLEFLAKPDPAALDASCIDTIRPPPFRTQ